MTLQLNLGARQKVFVVHIGSDNYFFVHQDTDEAYGVTELSTRIQDRVESGQLQVVSPKVGERCFALSEADNAWYRAIITNYSGSLVTVYYVDYGNTEQIPGNNLFDISEPLFSTPYQAIQCVLSDFISTTSSSALNRTLEGMILNKDLYAIVQSKCSDSSLLVPPSIPSYNVTLFESQDSVVSLSNDLVKGGLGHFRICSSNVDIGKKYAAYTSFDDSPGKFWVHFSDQVQNLQELMDSLNNEETVQTLQPLPFSSMIPGVACSCCYEEDGLYYRAEIVSIVRSEKINICFVDYGNCTNVAASEIKQLPAHLVASPLFAVQCCLEGIKPIKPAKPDPKLGNIAWKKQDCVKFTQLTQEVELEVQIICEISPEIFSIHLRDISKAEDIGKMLCDSNFAQVAVPKANASQSVESQPSPQYQYLELEIGKAYKNLFISYAESPAVVWCQPAQELSKYETLMEDLAGEAPNLPPLKNLKVDLPCCVLYDADESWCRGCIQSITPSTVTARVLFVDFGNVESVKHANIKPLPSKYLSFPAQAVSFSLASVTPRGNQSEWSKEAIESIQGLIVERNINCKIVGVDSDGYPTAKLFDPLQQNSDIALELVNRGYAKLPLTSNDTRGNSSFSSSASSPVPSTKGRSRDLQKASPAPSATSRHSSRSKGSPQSSPFHGKHHDSSSPSHAPKYSVLKLQPGQSIEATVYHVESLTEFYIQLKSSASELEQLMLKMNAHCKSSDAMAIPSPHQGLPMLAQYSGDGNWHRATLVAMTTKNSCEVVFADYGNTEIVDLSHLLQTPSKFLKLPVQAIQCSMNGVSTDKKFPDAIIDAFGHLTIEQDFQVHVKQITRQGGKEIYVVELVTSTGDSVLNQLIQQGSIQDSFLESTVSTASVPFPHLPAKQPLDVVMSYVETPSSFTLQLAGSYSDLETLSDDLQACYSQLSANQEVLSNAQVGSFCAAQFSEDQLWYRGRVIGVNDNRVNVLFIDFGNSEAQSPSALKVVRPEFAVVPCFGVPCCLAGIHKAEKYTKEDLDVFTKLVEKKLVAVFEKPFSSYEDIISVQLTDTSQPEVDVLDSIRPAAKGSVTSKQSSIHIPEVTPVSNCPMESTVSNIVNPEELYCQLVSEKELFDGLMNKMYGFYGESREGSPVLSPTVGSYCAALYSDDGSWYRGQITAISPRGVTVFYLDYGNTESVDSSSLRALEPEFCGIPIQGLKCHLSSIEPGWSSKCVPRLQDLLLEKSVEVICSEYDSSKGYAVQLIVEGEDIADVLHREGLATTTSPVCSPNKGSPASLRSLVIDPYPITKGAEYHVIITCALSPLEVYVQILDEDEKLDCLMQEIAEHCSSAVSCSDVDWKPGDYILAKFTEDDMWYRGCILNTTTKDKSTFEVFYVDYGNSELLDKSRFRRVKQAFCNLPAQVVKCRVEGAQYYKYTPQSTQEFNDLLFNQEFQMTCLSVTEDNACAVDLNQDKDGADVMSLAISRNIVQVKISTVSSNACTKLSVHVFPDGVIMDSFHDVIVVYAESPSNFFCQFSLSSIDVLSQLMAEMEEFYTSDSGEVESVSSFKIGDFVAAQFSEDDSWYRAVIVDIKTDVVGVIFVDYGNSETVKPSKLRTIAPQFTNLSAQAVPCCIAEVAPFRGGQWSEEAIAKFSKLTLEHSYIAQIKSSQDKSGQLFKFGDNQQFLEITLIDAETSKSPAEELVQLGLAVTSAPSTASQEVSSPGHYTQPATATPITSITSTLFINPSLQAGETYEVYVSFVESPSNFWLQLASSEESLSAIQENINLVCSDEFSQLVDPLPSASCCSKFSQDGNWYRSIIKAKHANGVDVLFVDYGNSEVVSLSDIGVINPTLLSWETQAFCCSLHGCHPADEAEVWSENAVGIFSELVMDKPLHASIISTSGDKGWKVKLIDGDSDVCDQLIQCEVAVKERLSTAGAVSGPNISPVDLTVGQEYSVYIAYIDSPSNFFCQLSSDYDKLESLMAEIADFYNENTLEPLLEEGAYCVAQYSSNFAWYRARIISIMPDGILVNFIDYGNSEIVAAQQILALEAHFATLPSQAISCSIVESENYPLSDEVLDRFIEYDLNQDFTICVNSLTTDGQYLVRLYDQEGGLVNESLYSAQPESPLADAPTIAPLPTVSLVPAIDSYHPLQYDIGKCVDVVVSHIVSPTSFFCQPQELGGELDDMMTDISSYMNSESYQLLPQESMQSGMVCLAQYTEDNEWYRAVIEEVISESNALVHFADYGNKEVITLDRISVLPSRFGKLPLQSFHCSVFSSLGVDMSWNVDQVDQFRSLVPDNEPFTVEVQAFLPVKHLHLVLMNRNGQPVDLGSLLGEKVDLSASVRDHANFGGLLSNHTSIIAVKGSKTPSRESGSDNGETETTDDGSEGKPLIQAPFKLSLAVEEVLEVSVVFVESPSLIYVQRADCKAELDGLSEEIAQYCASFEQGRGVPLTFCEGDFVLSKWMGDEMWYRGEIIGVDSTSSDSAAKVTFIDYGNVAVISSEVLVMCPKHFLELPAQAIPCSLAQVPHRDSWPMAYKDLITEIVEDKAMLASVVLPGSQGMKATVKLEDLETKVDISQVVLAKLQDECEGGSNEVIAEEEEEGEEEGKVIPEEEGMVGEEGSTGDDVLPEGDEGVGSNEVKLEEEGVEGVVGEEGSTGDDVLPEGGEGVGSNEVKLEEEGIEGVVREEGSTGDDVLPKGVSSNDVKLEEEGVEGVVREEGSTGDDVLPKGVSSNDVKLEEEGVEGVVREEGSTGDDVLPEGDEGVGSNEVKLEEEGVGGGGHGYGEVVLEEEDRANMINATRSAGTEESMPLDLNQVVLPERDAEFHAPGSTHRVFVISAVCPRSLVCQLSSEADALTEVTDKLSELYNETELSSLLLSNITDGLFVAAQFSEDKQWYRAKIISSSDTPLYKVLYVDFGNVESVRFESIKPLDRSLAVYPPLALLCSLSGVEPQCGELEFLPEAVERLMELAGDEECTVQVVSVDGTGCCGVILTTPQQVNIAAALIEENFASLVHQSVESTSPGVGVPPDDSLTSPVVESVDSTSSTIKFESEPGGDNLGDSVHSTPSTIESLGATSDPAEDVVTKPVDSAPPTLQLSDTEPEAVNEREGGVQSEAKRICTPAEESEAKRICTPAEEEPIFTSSGIVSSGAVLDGVPLQDQEAVSPHPVMISLNYSTELGEKKFNSTLPLDVSDTIRADFDFIAPPITDFSNPSPPDRSPPESPLHSSLPESPHYTPPDSPPRVPAGISTDPEASTLLPTASKYLTTTLTIGSQHSVRIIAVSSPDCFSCQFIDRQDQLEELMDTIASRKYQIEAQGDLQCVHPEPFLPVCACCTKGDVWQRGLIVSTSQAPKVLYVDNGNTESLPLERIKLLEECFSESLPPQSIKCNLPVLLDSDLNPDHPSSWESWELTWPVSCIKHFISLTGAVGKEATPTLFCLELLALNEDGTHVVRLHNDQLDVRNALVASMQDTGRCVIREEVAEEASFTGEEDTDKERIGYANHCNEGGEVGADALSLQEETKDVDVIQSCNENEDTLNVIMNGKDPEPEVSQDTALNGGVSADENNGAVAKQSFKYPETEWTVGADINLVYLSGSSPNYFTCHFFDEIQQLEVLMEEIAEYAAMPETIEPPTDVCPGDPIIAKFSEDGVWYRAQVLGCDSEENVEVLFVDYGNTECVPVADTLPIPQHFTTLRKQAATYRLSTESGFTREEWSGEAFEKFEQLAQNSECLAASVVSIEGDSVLVSLKCDTALDFAQ